MSKFTFWTASLTLAVATAQVVFRCWSGTATLDLGLYAAATFLWWLCEFELYLLRSRPTVAWITGDDSYPYITATKPNEYIQELVVK